MEYPIQYMCIAKKYLMVVVLFYDNFKMIPTEKNVTEKEMKMQGNPYFITFSNTYILGSSSVFNALNLMKSNTV